MCLRPYASANFLYSFEMNGGPLSVRQCSGIAVVAEVGFGKINNGDDLSV